MPSKYQCIAEDLRDKITNGTYTERLPTEKEICDLYHVSRQTARNALAVLVNEGYIVRRQGSGTTIATDRVRSRYKNARTIAIVTTFISDYIFPRLLADIQSVLSENGYDTLLFDSQSSFSRERTILQRILASDTIAGVIFEGVRSHIPNPNADLYRKCSNLGIPFVFIHGVNYELGNVISVLDDNYNGAHMLTEYLYRLGHRRIGGIFRIDDMQGAERFKGYSSAMRELGLPLNDTDTYWFYTYTALDTIPNESYFHSYWQDPKNTIKDCTAFICYSDIVAANLVHFLQENGYSVPGDYSVVAFDNDIAGEHCTPRITSLAHTGQSIGTLAADTLIRMIRGESCSSARVPWTLIEKESCAPLEK